MLLLATVEAFRGPGGSNTGPLPLLIGPESVRSAYCFLFSAKTEEGNKCYRIFAHL